METHTERRYDNTRINIIYSYLPSRHLQFAMIYWLFLWSGGNRRGFIDSASRGNKLNFCA